MEVKIEMSDFKITSMTPEILSEKFPDVFKAIEEKGHIVGLTEGKETGFKEGHSKGFNAGSAAERKRIASVEAQCLVGHEALIAQLKADGKTTGEQAAIMVLNAEKEKRKTRLQALEETSIKPVPPSNTDAVQFNTIDPNLPIEEKAKVEWDKTPAIRAEFGSVQSYTAYMKAIESGRAKILNKGGK